jgi:hypothetical protein
VIAVWVEIWNKFVAIAAGEITNTHHSADSAATVRHTIASRWRSNPELAGGRPNIRFPHRALSDQGADRHSGADLAVKVVLL